MSGTSRHQSRHREPRTRPHARPQAGPPTGTSHHPANRRVRVRPPPTRHRAPDACRGGPHRHQFGQAANQRRVDVFDDFREQKAGITHTQGRPGAEHPLVAPANPCIQPPHTSDRTPGTSHRSSVTSHQPRGVWRREPGSVPQPSPIRDGTSGAVPEISRVGRGAHQASRVSLRCRVSGSGTGHRVRVPGAGLSCLAPGRVECGTDLRLAEPPERQEISVVRCRPEPMPPLRATRTTPSPFASGRSRPRRSPASTSAAVARAGGQRAAGSGQRAAGSGQRAAGSGHSKPAFGWVSVGGSRGDLLLSREAALAGKSVLRELPGGEFWHQVPCTHGIAAHSCRLPARGVPYAWLPAGADRTRVGRMLRRSSMRRRVARGRGEDCAYSTGVTARRATEGPSPIRLTGRASLASCRRHSSTSNTGAGVAESTSPDDGVPWSPLPLGYGCRRQE